MLRLTEKGKVLALVVVFLATSMVMYNIPLDTKSTMYDLVFGLLEAVRWLVIVELFVVKIRS